MSDIDPNRKIAVILVADVVGYSKHMEHDENSTLQAYSECEKILKQFYHWFFGAFGMLYTLMYQFCNKTFLTYVTTRI